MDIKIYGHHFDLGDALQVYITDKLEVINEKYFGRAINVSVNIDKETKSLFRTHISLAVGKDIQVSATAKTHDVHASFDEAAEKIAKQLRRYKRKLKDHHEQMESAEAMRVPEYTFGKSLLSDQVDQLTDSEIESQDEPMIIAEMTTNIQTMSVSDAVMRLNLSGNNAMLFHNSKNNAINMVYVRQDGNVGWVDTKQATDALAQNANAA
jgi:ribosomal subunit interface protein